MSTIWFSGDFDWNFIDSYGNLEDSIINGYNHPSYSLIKECLIGWMSCCLTLLGLSFLD